MYPVVPISISSPRSRGCCPSGIGNDQSECHRIDTIKTQRRFQRPTGRLSAQLSRARSPPQGSAPLPSSVGVLPPPPTLPAHLRPLTPLTLGLPPHPRPVPLSPPPPLPFLSDISTTGFASDLVRTDNKLLYNRFCGGTGGYGHRGDDDDDNVLISFSRSTAYVVVSFLFLLLLSPLHSGLFVSLPL
uniref:TYR_PHOSPHATASE_2 domain-containing protein n=1 Tax=Mesocestoides corti TaxID=53468 RepID=A0A5K3FGJ4_MESCO